MFSITPEDPADSDQIDALLDEGFGSDRRERTVYRLRLGPPVPGLALAARAAGRLVATLRFWPVLVEPGAPALLLGPLAVEAARRGGGIGRALVADGLVRASATGWPAVIVVGEPAYYAPFGFRPAAGFGLVLPGPVEPERFQALELVSGALASTGPGVRLVLPWPTSAAA